MVSLIIPCFNEEDNIYPFFDLCEKTLGEEEIEYIFVNDGSIDDTFHKITNLVHEQENKNIVGVNFSRNFGKEAAMLAGFSKSTGEFVCIVDADCQQNPKYISEMLTILRENPEYDCVACYQEKRKESKILTFCKQVFYKSINKISNVHFEENASDFRTFRSDVVSAILSLNEYYRFSKGIFSWVGFNTYYMPYTVEERQFGTTSWSFKKLTKYAIDGFVGFSTAPLKIATWLGVGSALVSAIYFISVLIEKIVKGINVSGYTTIVCLILLIGGIQMILLGIIGEYLARTYIEVKRRPIYIIKSIDETAKRTQRRKKDGYR